MDRPEATLLCVNVGNTHIALALSDGTRILSHWRIGTRRDITSDEAAALLDSLCRLSGHRFGDIRDAVVTSVVPQVNQALAALFERYLHIEGLFVRHTTDTGMPIKYSNPAEVGSDRIVNSVGAYQKFQRPCIVVDLGTATTFDCVSSDGVYLGGAIAPGLTISMEALVKRGSKLPKLDSLSEPPAAIGLSTVDSMKSGILYGYAGLVDGIVARMKREMEGSAFVVATGGTAPLMAGLSTCIDCIEPFLTFEGLLAVFRRNRPPLAG